MRVQREVDRDCGEYAFKVERERRDEEGRRREGREQEKKFNILKEM